MLFKTELFIFNEKRISKKMEKIQVFESKLETIKKMFGRLYSRNI